jgi:hypothetical protein
MSKLDAFEFDFLKQVFYGTAITNISATAGTTTLWAGLHTADPGDSGTTAAEGGYSTYARVAVARSSTGWAASSGGGSAAASVSPVANIDFPAQDTTSTGTFTHFTIYPASGSLATAGLYNGTVTPNINFGAGVTPRLTTGSSITET